MVFYDPGYEAASEHTLSVFTENRVGLLGRVTATFTRRCLNIESLTVSESEVPGVHRFTIVVRASAAQARKVAAQLERQVDVLKAFVHGEGDVVMRDLALYKLDGRHAGPALDAVVAAHGARVLERSEALVVLELTGSEGQTTALFEALGPFGVAEFVRSGRVALTRPMRPLESFLEELEAASAHGD